MKEISRKPWGHRRRTPQTGRGGGDRKGEEIDMWLSLKDKYELVSQAKKKKRERGIKEMKCITFDK